MARFFIDRPIFAWVIAIVVMMAGTLAIFTLPVEQYPRIAPPAVSISAYYPGASAKTLENTVTQVIEQKMNGIDHFRYMSSTSDSSGNLTITVTFDPEADPDIAQVQVQNKLQLAMPLLPQEVQQQGVRVNKSSKSFLMAVGLISADGRMKEHELTDFIVSNVQDPISRVNGVGEVMTFGSQHAMRIWLDPIKLENYQLTVTEVAAAIEAENAEVTAGQLGGTPAVAGQQLNATVTVQSRMQTPEEFANVLLRVNTDGSQVRLRDVAGVELGSEGYDITGRYNGKPAGGMAIRLATGANALDTAARVRARMDELKGFFPAGVEVVYPYDTTPFVKISIEEVVETLGEAIVLVFLVMWLFLQNLRATLIPTIAVPVVLLGTFGVLAACGFSINTLTMFAMVLAIGLLVDDAIVVVENVERIMSEEGLPPREATRKSMTQITGALVGIALVLSAVFVPMAFFGGSTGVIYRQFSLTVVSAMVLSVLVALILTPALCATLLKPTKLHEGGRKSWFNRGFDRVNAFYRQSVHYVVRRIVRVVLVYAAIFVALGFLFARLPTAFLPDEDQGILLVQFQLPVGATKERSLEVARQIGHHFATAEKDTVDSVMSVAGFSFAGRGQNMGMAFVMMKDWELRDTPDKRVGAVARRAMAAFAGIRDALVFAFAPPAIIELGTSNGFDFELMDRAGLGHERLTEARNQLLGMAAKNPDVAMVRPNGMDDTPQFRIVVDREKASAFGLSLADVNNTLSTAWGSAYVNDFIENGRVKKAYLQADARFRMLPSDVDRWYVRNAKGDMVPVSSFARGEWTYGSPRLERYNGVPAMEILGAAAPGKSTGEAMAAIEAMAAQLPPGIGYEWTGLSYEERLSGAQAPALYAISVIVVFLCLAALYESWTVPVSVILVVPLGVVGAVAAVTLRGLPNDIYFQVGLLTTVGLSAKNAILIVEFAKSLYDGGMDLIEATALACRQRLRPILMTSFAFILGVLPLAVATGAGSGSQNAIGVGVMGGMISATVLAIFFVPVFFVAVMRLFRRRPAPAADPAGNLPSWHRQ